VRRLPALTLAALLLAGCGHTSHLPADDQQFCASLGDDPVKTLRDDVDHLVDNDHFASSGDAMAFASVDLQQSENVLNSANLQDSGLAAARDAATSAILDLSIATDSQTTSADPGLLGRVQATLRDLQSYCDTH
jgi:hypothetical protein